MPMNEYGEIIRGGETNKYPKSDNNNNNNNNNNNSNNNGGGRRSNSWGIIFIIAIIVAIYIGSQPGPIDTQPGPSTITPTPTPKSQSSQVSPSNNGGNSGSSSQTYTVVLHDYGLYKDGHGISDSDYVIADSDSRYLTSEDTNKLTLKGINYAKNELYARHGRKFAASELKSFFGSRTWYYGYMAAEVESDWAIQNVFNKYEEYNKNLLRDLENSLGPYDVK